MSTVYQYEYIKDQDRLFMEKIVDNLSLWTFDSDFGIISDNQQYNDNDDFIDFLGKEVNVKVIHVYDDNDILEAYKNDGLMLLINKNTNLYSMFINSQKVFDTEFTSEFPGEIIYEIVKMLQNNVNIPNIKFTDITISSV